MRGTEIGTAATDSAAGATVERRYALEVDHLVGHLTEVPCPIIDEGDINALYHRRMFGFIAPLVEKFVDCTWITVGDNGGEAHMLKQSGIRDVTASSISDVHLRHLAAAGHLDRIGVRALNAERMDLPDNSVDVLLCKEAFHHFPRAPLAFYEFIRVSRLGFILIEPIDMPKRPLDIGRSLAKMILRRRGRAFDQFEPVGNFIYRVSPQEIHRSLTALQMPWFAMRGFNNFVTRSLLKKSRKNVLAMTTFRLGIAVQDILVRMRLMSLGMAVIFVPTGATAPDYAATLAARGFTIVRTPRNPYLASNARDRFLD
jgi:SAM-dependent methyltransferase